MAGPIFRSLTSNLLSCYAPNNFKYRSVHSATVYYAARKGTRAKARAKKVKVEVTKVGFIPHNQRVKDRSVKVHINKHMDDSYKKVCPDDVFPMKYFRWVVYTAEEAVKTHQETHHPSVYNMPAALLFAQVELNMEAAKKNRYLDNIQRFTLMPNPFPRDEDRTILAFCKDQKLMKEALDAGATLVGSTDIIKKIQEGEIRFSDYDYVVAHPNILTDLVPIRGLMKRRFPNIRSGTLDPNIGELVKKFKGGVQYRVMKDDHQQNFGSVEVPIGRCNMDPKQVAENIDFLLKDIQAARPKRDGLFITRCFIVCPPSKDKLKIDPFVHVERELTKEVQQDSDDEGEPLVAAA